MIDIIKKYFGAAGDKADTRHDLRVATCALLVEMARIDDSFSPQEIETIFDILETRYGLSGEHAEALLAKAEAELVESVDLWQFARLINAHYSREEKIGIIEILWQVVFVDGKMDQHEDYLMHKLSKLQRLNHVDLIEAKLKVRHGSPARP